MKKGELKIFKKLLIDERENIETEMHKQGNANFSRSQRDFSGDLSGYSFHMADVGTDAYDREFAGNLITGEQKMLFEIDEALLRIEDGSYGICQNCNRSIGKKRLEVVPYARLCRRCKQKVESGL